ncbi:NADH-dependent flavin oxidoreductase-like protein [Mollisia scopiformis]|uniref:NADH-dependent flavin oxidoreductase-like protein n=1 Tax=Mollisia scopiformis TaxID=149040 RepID=A0A194XEI8_MOLSC|nr:NADH-dependent flavin oxidoreductase-like protein [Mollisia scopiformis]KUJ18605.1 NADH-dependent flavin oxidoreductase-like protein [Mollisia scopiformis]
MGSTATPQNTAAPNAPYFTPIQSPPAGTALSDNPPTLFSPLKIRDVTFQNRIWVAPMCMYSADKGHLTDFHLVHLGAFAYRGASLTIVEATSVLANGGITPQDAGLWTDSQIAPLKRVADFIHSQNQKIGIQLAHAGRKASCIAPWLVERGKALTATEDVGGWPDDVMGASAIKWGEGYPSPREMTSQDIKDVINGFRDSARRSVEAGIDVIEIHAAHGYLLSSFLSPTSNKRTDAYGGNFENRIRILIEIITSIRAVIPEGMPLLVRVSATEWLEESDEPESWKVEDTIRLAKLLPALGVDLLDVSSGGNNEKQRITPFNDFQVGIAGQVREALFAAGVKDLLIGAVGMITEAEAAKAIVENGKALREAGSGMGDSEGTEGAGKVIEIEDEQGAKAKADIVLVARQFLREPEWALRVAYRLGVKVQWPQQYHRGQFVKGSRI